MYEQNKLVNRLVFSWVPFSKGVLESFFSSFSVVYILCDVSYLVAVYSVLGRPGRDGDGVWLAAAITLTVSILSSLPEDEAQCENKCLPAVGDNNHREHLPLHSQIMC